MIFFYIRAKLFYTSKEKMVLYEGKLKELNYRIERMNSEYDAPDRACYIVEKMRLETKIARLKQKSREEELANSRVLGEDEG